MWSVWKGLSAAAVLGALAACGGGDGARGVGGAPPSDASPAGGSSGGNGGGGLGLGGGGSSGASPQPSCQDAIKNQSESDVDCGGECEACVIQRACTSDADCGTRVCREGRCREASCDDSRQDGQETDVDCGGSCGPCNDGATCAQGYDCTSLHCAELTCQPATCDDHLRNGQETDVDCGGSCPTCALGKKCETRKDCETGVCQVGLCVAQSCADEQENQSETDVDCGGSCRGCGTDQGCLVSADCQSLVCSAGSCVAATCEDDTRNGEESDLDCGGGTCERCPDTAQCQSAEDCASAVCAGGACLAPSCSDGVKNGRETARDCGGGCAPCSPGSPCSLATDCDSGICLAAVCASARCDDQLKNGNETDVDCGGSCAACAPGLVCEKPADCQSELCSGGKCTKPSCNDKVSNGSETGVDCGGGCDACPLTSPCNQHADCSGGACLGGRCGLAGFDLDANERFGDPAGWGLTSGDLDNDGDLDLVGALHVSSPLGIRPFLNDGTGRFQPRPLIVYDTTGVVDIALADLDRDGNLDLVVATNQPLVLVGRGKGDATFAPFERYVSVASRQLNVVDIDHDGNLDIAQSNVWLRGSGQGTFGALATLSGLADGEYTAGDLDGDGVVDLSWRDAYWATTNGSNWLNDGQGHFRAAPDGDCSGGHLADLDGDGDLDMAVKAGVLQVCENDGHGALRQRMFADTSEDTLALASGDFDKDGLTDLVVVPAPFMLPAGLFVLSNRGRFGFGQAQRSVVGVTPSVDSTVVGDFDNDGNLDVAVGGNWYNNLGGIQVLLGRKNGLFRAPETYNFNVGQPSFVLQDLNADGLLDAVNARWEIAYNRGRSHAPLTEPVLLDPGLSDLHLVDLDKDGDLDLLGAAWQGITVYQRTGPSSFAEGKHYEDPSGSYASEGAEHAATGDFDGDGDIDVALAAWGASFSTGFSARGQLEVYLNDGTGTFGAPKIFKSGFGHPKNIIAVSRPGQAIPSLAIVDQEDDTLKLAAPTGGGNFATPSSFGTAFFPTALRAADVDGDHVQDIVVVGGLAPMEGVKGVDWAQQWGSLQVHFGAGSHGTAQATAALGHGPVSLAVGDLDGDGRDDMAVASAADRTLTVVRPVGPGGALVSRTYGVQGDVNTVHIADMDKDGRLDVFAGSPYTLLRNLGGQASVLTGPVAGCGNGSIDAGEACDGANLAGKTCASVVGRKASGALKCSKFCAFDVSACTPSTPCGPLEHAQANAPWPMLGRCANHVGRSDQDGPQSGAVVWRYETAAADLGAPAIAADGTVMVAGTDGQVYAINGNGTLKYKYDLAGPSTATPALASDGSALVPTGLGHDYLQIATGTYQGRRRDAGGLMSSATIGRSRDNFAKYLYGYGLAKAVVTSAVPLDTDGNVTGAVAVGTDDTVYLATLGGSLYAAALKPNPSANYWEDFPRVLWRQPLGEPAAEAPTISASGIVYQPVSDGSLRAFTTDGSLVWATFLEEGLGAAALAADGTLYITSTHHLFAVNPDGSIAWSLAGAFAGSAPSVGKDGKVYVGVDGASLAIVSPTGVLLFTVISSTNAPQSRRVPQPAIGTNKRLYFVAGGVVSAIGP